MDKIMEVILSVEEERVLDSLRKKSVTYKSLEAISTILHSLSKNKIDPLSLEGKHASADLQNAVDEFNNVFKEHGLNPNLKIDWNLC